MLLLRCRSMLFATIAVTSVLILYIIRQWRWSNGAAIVGVNEKCVDFKQEIAVESSSVVPKIVHFVWFHPKDEVLRFHQFISLLSVHNIIKPKKIIIWNNNPPSGIWWEKFLAIKPDLALLPLNPPDRVFDRKLKHPEHKSDVARIEILLKYGGIYIDFDVIILKSFDSLLEYDVTMGAETPNLLGSGIILSKPNSTFIQLWKKVYKNFEDADWNQFSVKKPMEIAKTNPGLVHIEWFGFHRPNWSERKWIFEDGFFWDWSENYAMHLWYRTHNKDYDPVSIRHLNSTLGEVLRFVYYNSSAFWQL